MPSAGLTKDSWASYRGEKLIDCRCRISGDHKGGQLFRRRLRVPFLLFERERGCARERGCFQEGLDICKWSIPPLELKILALLRVLGRGYYFGDFAELCEIGEGKMLGNSFTSLIDNLQKNYFVSTTVHLLVKTKFRQILVSMRN